jgi:hypothetical protein
MRRGLLIAFAAALVAALVGAALVARQRRVLLEQALGRWLDAYGVPSSARVSRIGLGGLRLDGVVLGAPDAPDMTADRIQVRWSLASAFGGRATLVTGSGVRLRARLRDGRLSLGTLDRLVAPGDGRSGTRVAVPFDAVVLRDARVEVLTPWGMATAAGTVAADTHGRVPRARADLETVTPWMEGRVLGRATYESSPAGDAVIRWHGRLLVPTFEVPGHAIGVGARTSVSGRGATVRARFLAPDVLSTWQPPVVGPITLRGTAAGTLERLAVDATATEKPAREATPGAPAGSARLRGTVHLAGGALAGDVTVAVKDVDVTTPGVVARRVSGAVAVRLGGVPSTPPGQMLAMAALETALPLGGGLVVFELTKARSVVLERSEWAFLGGTIHARGRVPLAARERAIAVTAEGIDLGVLLTSLSLEGLSGTGRLAGEFPLRQQDGRLLVENGRLAATGPGTLRYQAQPGTEAMRTRYHEMNVLLTALEDFHYDALSLTLSGDTAGPMAMALHVRGRNPQYEGGREVVLNVNVEAPLAGLVRTGSSAYRVPEAIEKKLDAMGLGRRR